MIIYYFNDLVSLSLLNAELKIRVKTGTNTLTSIFENLNAPCLCVCTTENITDKPAGKYGNILILKITSNRQTALCLTNDGLCYINSYNTSTSALTGWKQL